MLTGCTPVIREVMVCNSSFLPTKNWGSVIFDPATNGEDGSDEVMDKFQTKSNICTSKHLRTIAPAPYDVLSLIVAVKVPSLDSYTAGVCCTVEPKLSPSD